MKRCLEVRMGYGQSNLHQTWFNGHLLGLGCPGPSMPSRLSSDDWMGERMNECME